MRPQENEPCVNCKHWSNRKGCKMDRYNSTSMVMFGHCGFCQPKPFKHTDVKIHEELRSKKMNRYGSNWIVHEKGEDMSTLVRSDVYLYPEKHSEDGAIWRVRTDFLNSKNFEKLGVPAFLER